VAPAAMLFFATLNQDFNERVHWYNQCHKQYPLTKSGENALLAMAIDYENQGNKEKAIENYGKYLATYPNGIYKQDVQSSIKNINTPVEDLIKQFEEAQNKPQ
jgi:outer membrane protein assembly factor BamD (BamD/ComL family)